MLGLPGIPATAVMRPPPTAGPRLRKRIFSSGSLDLASSDFCAVPLSACTAEGFSAFWFLPAWVLRGCCLSDFGSSPSRRDGMLAANANTRTDFKSVFIRQLQSRRVVGRRTANHTAKPWFRTTLAATKHLRRTRRHGEKASRELTRNESELTRIYFCQ